MNIRRFDRFAQALLDAPSRRSFVGLALSGIGLMGGLTAPIALPGAEAKKKKRKKKCPKLTCNDNVKNGSESDIDCGGNCNRCINGKTCNDRDDCMSAFCSQGRCSQCSPGQCGSDANGACRCEEILVGEFAAFACNSDAPPVVSNVLSCGQCPPNLNCFFDSIDLQCVLPCGATVG